MDQLLDSGYVHWFLRNSQSVQTIERFALALVYMAPGLSNAEVRTEGVASILRQFTSINDFIWDMLARKTQREGDEFLPLDIDPHIISSLQATPVFPLKNLPISILLSIIQNLQLFLELAAIEWGETKWRTLFIMEITKAILRLILLVQTKGKILAHRLLPKRYLLPIDG
eukprot:TRINITY_DN1626_c0_g1_i2.p1 TRINITY_DN1626_c0_g1~~TRINITY_DN1626_c0_g1_i2.p1  ORF type:complete len:170 (+),score=26.04 TRINITY_DN1626_c0_g1_i2:81-590(+)